MVVEVAQPGDNYEQVPLTDGTLNPKGMEIINEAAWDTGGIRCVTSHPDDEAAIRCPDRRREDCGHAELGPYRGNREPGMFDWAYSSSTY